MWGGRFHEPPWTKSAMGVIDTEEGVEDLRREEGSAGTIGLGTIFQTHGKAHDLQVRGK
jgi:hypothetical protein